MFTLIWSCDLSMYLGLVNKIAAYLLCTLKIFFQTLSAWFTWAPASSSAFITWMCPFALAACNGLWWHNCITFRQLLTKSQHTDLYISIFIVILLGNHGCTVIIEHSKFENECQQTLRVRTEKKEKKTRVSCGNEPHPNSDLQIYTC